ncbi:restriction endonuclease subunit S [Ligilactobacillus agilis]|uniref:restriction endonuclease subunit S n=1 Tax=Ligilactobacillus agilis TaxID=1601 RepID=UPI002551276B|nr:restriction endonuclease subunit S [Ligilactobacillus agilis]MDK6809058.1 restriction endonuclease subunit S [Ligilactobacillus agilis]
MDKEKIGIPKLRFPGFTGAWEQRRLGEVIVSEHKGKVKSSMKGGNTNYLETNYLNGGIAQKVNVRADVSKNDVLILWDGSKAGTVYHGFEGALGSTLKAYVPKCSGDFLYQILKKDQDKIYQRYRTPNIPHVIKNFTEKFIVLIPDVREQEKIAEFFNQLDSLIALHQRKLEHLKQQKNGLLQKMFPKNGESVPDVRFPGFTDPWEQRRLGEYYEFKNGLNKGKEFFGDGTPIVNFVDVFHNRGLISRALGGSVQLTPKEISNYEVKKGDLFFTRTSETIEEIGYPSVMLDNPHNTVFSGFVLRGRCVEESDPLENIFKKYVFFTDTFRQEMMKKSSMTTRALTSGTALKSMLFRFPVSRVEQRKIGELITKLDSLIALYQRKLEHLELLKKGLLQQMFV